MNLREFETIRKIIQIFGIVLMVFGLIILRYNLWFYDIPVSGLIILVGFLLFCTSRWAR